MSRLTAYSANSFGDPNAQPPTPRQTPTSATFPSPVFATPQQQQGEFGEPGSWTPHFAEGYTVFNTTPGNREGGHPQFTGFTPFTPTSQVGVGHKRQLSSDSTSTEVQHRPGQYSPTFPASFQQLATPALKASGQTQTATPPPTSNKEGRKLAPKLKMQQDGQEYPQPDFGGVPPNDLTGFFGSPSDLFSYPMSAPVTGPENNFWDPASLDIPMDMDFGATNIFEATSNPIHNNMSNHRHSTSFDWNSEVHMFQSPPQPAPIPVQKQQKAKPQARKARALAPKPPVVDPALTMDRSTQHHPVLMSNASMENNPFAMGAGDEVNPGNAFPRSQSATHLGSFTMMSNMGQAEAAIAATTSLSDNNNIRRSTSFREAKSGKMPDRASASSPIKASVRPGLTRSQSENRGRKPVGRSTVVNQPNRSMAGLRNGPSLDVGRLPRSGRLSPLKKQNRLSGLASIPESATRPGSRASVKFYIGADGRAHAEAMESGSRPGSHAGSRSRSSSGHPEDDEFESSDDEPIIIPSRNTSFNTSFALPDPRKPVGSIFHPARRSISDRSGSTITASDGTHNLNDAVSEAETVMDGEEQEGGNAANELLKVRENRQHLTNSFSGLKSQRLFGLPGTTHRRSISPSRTDSGNTTDEPGVRCVCNKNDFTGFLVQCESCELWQHGACVNQHAQPRVYICAFCAHTPNMRGSRLRDTGRSGLDFGVASSPLANKSKANKSFRSFR